MGLVTVNEVPVSVRIKKRKKSPEYFGVSSIVTEQGALVYGAALSSKMLPAIYATEREAAKAVDVMLIKQGKDPVNILKPAAK